MKMKTIKTQAAQGDVLFMRVDAVPKGFEPQKNDGPIVVAHSETGHHHTVPGLGATLFTNRADPMTSYLRLGDDIKDLLVTHHRQHDTHQSFALGGGGGAVWLVRRQREHTPEGWRRVED